VTDAVAASGANPVPVMSLDELERGPLLRDPAPPAADEAAFIQYSSGSTSAPKGCVLTTGAIDAQLDMLAERLELEEGERGVSWLPLSHDMGFFGCLMLCFAKGMDLVLGSPGRFQRAPRTWFDDCARSGATITAGPSSALALAARAARATPPGPLSVRKLVLGGERIEPAAIDAAMRALGPSGLAWSDLIPAYGLAEAVLAVTMTAVADPARVVHVRTDAMLEEELELSAPGAGSTPYVSLGKPLRGVRVTVDGGSLGEIRIESPSLASGYLRAAEERETFAGHALRTGDIGFLDGGDLFVAGRRDDLLCLGGHNVFAGEIEAELDGVAGVRPGTAVVVEVPSDRSHEVVILAEPVAGAADLATVAEALRSATARASGFSPDACLFVEPGTLPKTPSGKVQRFRCRSVVRDDDRVVARVAL
jgi:fatty-acyl-CoA synthase